jgi:hypothetical protein
MAELTVAGSNQKFWMDCIPKVSPNKVKGGESFQTHYSRLVEQAFQQQGAIGHLEGENREVREEGRDLAGRLEISIFEVETRNEILGVSPEDLEGYIARLGEELGKLQATDVPVSEADARERTNGIEKLRVKLEVAEGSLEVIGPFLEQLTKTTAALENSGAELRAAQEKFEQETQVLQDQIGALKREGIPAHTDRIRELTQELLEKTNEFTQLGLEHQGLVESAREAEVELGGQVKDLGGQLEEARRAQDVAMRDLDQQQRVNDELKGEHARVLREAGEVADERAGDLQRQLDAVRDDNARLTDRVRVLEEAPGAYVRNKAAMLERVAVAVLGAGPELGLLEARVGELREAEGRLGQLYDWARIPRGGGAFDALVGMIQAVARIFTTWGRDDAVSLAAYAANVEPHVAEINRKAGEHAGVVLARDNAVQALAREQAESKKLLSILGNGFSWTWNAATVVPSYIYDAMRF